MDLLNEALYNYFCDFELYDISDLSAVSRMVRIILGSKVPWFSDKIKNRIGLNKSFELSYEFFQFLGDDYGKYFLDRMSSDFLIFDYDKKGKEIACSFLDDNGNKRIYFPYNLNICDCFSLTHELFHDMNYDVSNPNVTRNTFTEYISIYSEILLEDFIKQNYDIKCSCNNRYTFNACYLKAVKIDFQINLISCFLKKGFVSEYDLDSIISSYSPYYYDYLYDLVNTIVTNGQPNIMYEFRYIIGILFSCYSRDLTVNGKFDINLYKYINDNINFMELEDVYKLFDLDIIDDYTLELSNESYSKLHKCYCNYMR